MAIKRHDNQIELSTIQAIVSHSDEATRIARLAAIRPEWFLPVYRPAVERLLTCYRRDGRVPERMTMAYDHGLTEEQRVVFAAHKDMDDSSFEHQVEALKKYWRIAEIADTYESIGEYVRTTDGTQDEIEHAKQAASRLLSAIASTDPMPAPIVVGHHEQSGLNALCELLITPPVKGNSYRTGYHDFDNNCSGGGIKRGSVMLISAGSGCGKSTLALSIAHNMAFSEGANVLYACGELEQLSLMSRHVSLAVSFDSILLEKHHIYEHCIPESVYRPLMIEYNNKYIKSQAGSLSFIKWTEAGIDDVLAQASIIGSDVLVVDYIQYLTETPKNREETWRVWSRVVKQAKIYAQRTNSVVILLSQTNAEGQLSESKAMEHHVDHHWSWTVDRDVPTAEIMQKKNRWGAPRSLYAECQWHYSRFVPTEKCAHEANLQAKDASGDGKPAKNGFAGRKIGGGR